MTEQEKFIEFMLDKMVDRFLAWPLPKDFAPDCGISFDADAAKKLNPRNARYEPVGTNLFTAEQAKAMFRYAMTPDHVDAFLMEQQSRGIGPLKR